jgi:hypothetical protein
MNPSKVIVTLTVTNENLQNTFRQGQGGTDNRRKATADDGQVEQTGQN